MSALAQGDDRERLEDVLCRIATPIAVAVSGGIDSLTLATLAHRLRPETEMFHAVSAAVPGDATAGSNGWPSISAGGCR